MSVTPPAAQTTGWDVLIVGAGPAGSASAGLLAKAGYRVLVLEKEHFPRFHIGESLIPAGLTVFERLGVEPRADSFVPKRGAQFICDETGRSQTFAFQDTLDDCPASAWHVDRAEFDTQLRDCAVSLGATVLHGLTVTNAGYDADSAWVAVGDTRYSGRFLIDASGLSRLCARISGTSLPYHCFGSSAAYTHFEGLSAEALAELGPHNDVRVMVRSDGWGWIIPLAGGRLSVGLVSAGKASVEQLESGLLAGPTVSRLTAGARRLDSKVVGNFSFRNTQPTGPRFAAIGDSACFLDPVFSSGVTLALHAAESVADRLSAALAAGRESDPHMLDEHVESMDRAYRTFEALIYRFYHTNIASTLFLADAEGMQGRDGVMSVLAGDVWRTDNPFQEMLLNAKRFSPRAQVEAAPAQTSDATSQLEEHPAP